MPLWSRTWNFNPSQIDAAPRSDHKKYLPKDCAGLLEEPTFYATGQNLIWIPLYVLSFSLNSSSLKATFCILLLNHKSPVFKKTPLPCACSSPLTKTHHDKACHWFPFPLPWIRVESIKASIFCIPVFVSVSGGGWVGVRNSKYKRAGLWLSRGGQGKTWALHTVGFPDDDPSVLFQWEYLNKILFLGLVSFQNTTTTTTTFLICFGGDRYCRGIFRRQWR